MQSTLGGNKLPEKKFSFAAMSIIAAAKGHTLDEPQTELKDDDTVLIKELPQELKELHGFMCFHADEARRLLKEYLGSLTLAQVMDCDKQAVLEEVSKVAVHERKLHAAARQLFWAEVRYLLGGNAPDELTLRAGYSVVAAESNEGLELQSFAELLRNMPGVAQVMIEKIRI